MGLQSCRRGWARASSGVPARRTTAESCTVGPHVESDDVRFLPRHAGAHAMSSTTNPVFRHPKRPDWGMGIVAQDLPDLLCAVFESGRTAKFFKTALPIVVVDLPDA